MELDTLWPTINALLLLAVPPLAAAAVAYVVKAAVEAWNEFRSANQEVAYAVEKAVDIAVKAAEQTGLIGEVKVKGADKKRYAIAVAETWLKAQGIKVDAFALSAAIEAAVFENFPKSK